MVNRNGLPEAKRRVTARVPSGQQRNNVEFEQELADEVLQHVDGEPERFARSEA